MTPDEFRSAGHALIEAIAAYREELARGSLPVQATVAPGAIAARLPGSAPEHGEPAEAVLADFHDLLKPGITHWQHPSFFGYFPANATLASVLGDLLSSGLGTIGLSWQSAPALTELETTVVAWMRQLLGLGEEFSGVLQDTASTASLVALLCARERTSGYSGAHGGLQSVRSPLTVYVSEQAHSSVEKAAVLAGFGRDFIRSVPTDAAFALNPAALAECIARDRAAGLTPCAIVATTGTTATTAIDPINAIGAIARREGVWLHVDAAMAGSGMLLPELRHYWDGIGLADSIIVNAHKWLGAVFDCTLYYVRDPEHLVRVMSTNPSYLRSAVDGDVVNYRDWGIPLGRRFRALKLWYLLRIEGAAALRARLRRDLDNARWLAGVVAATPGWRVVAPVSLQTVCVRHEPAGLVGEALDRHTQSWAARVNASGAAYLTPARVAGQWLVRVSIGAESTSRSNVEALWSTMRAAAGA
jgi:aromatic-L-amino-acid/L-tryptophan decarboxylase